MIINFLKVQKSSYTFFNILAMYLEQILYDITNTYIHHNFKTLIVRLVTNRFIENNNNNNNTEMNCFFAAANNLLMYLFLFSFFEMHFQ